MTKYKVTLQGKFDSTEHVVEADDPTEACRKARLASSMQDVKHQQAEPLTNIKESPAETQEAPKSGAPKRKRATKKAKK